MENLRLPKAPEIKFLYDANYKRKIEKARERMQPKPFIERFKTLNVIANVGTIFFPVISVLTSIAFLFQYINGAIQSFYVSIVLGISILSLVELTKNHLLNNGLDTYFSNSGKSTLTFIFALFFSIGSFIMSYQGAELLVQNLDNSKKQITINTASSINSTSMQFDNQIQNEQSKIIDLQQKVKKQWKGLPTKEQNKLLLQYESNIDYLRKLKREEIEKIRILSKKQMEVSDSSVKHNAYVFKIFAGTNELLTILSIVFIAFYAYKTVREDIDLNDFKNQPDLYNAIIPTLNQQVSISGNGSKHHFNEESRRNVISGFYKELNQEPRSPLNDESIRKRTCKYCGTEFEYKHWNKQYCSDSCRIANWERKTGKKLNINFK